MIPFSKWIISAMIYALLLHRVASEGNTTEPDIDDTSLDIDNGKSPDQETTSSDRPVYTKAVTIVQETIAGTQSVSASIQESTEATTEEDEHLSTKVYVSTTKSSATTDLPRVIPPEHTHAVWDSKGKICVLAKFHATFVINYPTKDGDQSVSIELPSKVVTKGKCGDNNNSPVLRLIWSVFEFILTFSTIPRDDEPDQWIVTGMELRYDTSPQLFDGAINSRKIIAKSKAVELYKTEMGRSFFCPATEVVHLYNSKKTVVTVRMRDIKLQPFDVTDGKFSKAQRCSQVVIEGSEEPFVQDETVPLAVGLTLTILTLVVVLGFSIHRAYTMRKVDYNSME